MGNSETNPLENKKGKLEKKYFSKIRTILTKKNCYNYSLKDNIKVSLSEKNFDQISDAPIQYFTLNSEESTNFIYWLDFIYQYLYEENSNKRYWASQMITELDKENFLSENKYLSEFFYEEFEFENAPKFLYKKKLKVKQDQKINLDNSYLSVTQNLGGSFSNVNNNYLDPDFANLKYKHFRDKVKGYINKFKQHIFDRDHPINRVTQIFEKIWVKYAEVIYNSLKDKDLSDKKSIKEVDNEVNDLTQELQRFVVHLQIALKLFYSRTINYAYFNEEKDELINLITTLLFRTGNIYSTIFDLYKLSLDQEIKKMAENFYNLKKITPEELGLNKQYCLNIISLNFQEEILTKKLEELENNNINNNINEINTDEEKDNSNDIAFQIKKIKIILELIKENKKKVPRYGDREIEETKVNLNFEENYDLFPNETSTQELGYEKTNTLNNIDEELGLKNMSLLPIHELYDEPNNNINNSSFCYSDQDEISTKGKFIPNKTMIIRTPTKHEKGKEKVVKIPKLQKILNRVSFTRTKNIEYLSYPYETAIQLLKQVKKYQTPFEKMMIFASISSEITDCINDFWKDLNEYIDSNLLNLEIDQLMTIFIYIIIQSQITDISVHCKLIKSFTTCITKASMIGYYYSTVEASVQYISSISNIKELFKDKVAK